MTGAHMSGAAAARAGRREWIGLALLALPTFVVAIDLFVLLLALPGLSADLGADGVQQLWITDVYGFLLAGFTVTMGDRIGRRRLLVAGAAAFAAASLLCAYAGSVEALIGARALLGVAGAAIGPATLALIGDMFPDRRQRATAFGVWGGVYTLGALAGPVIGGALLARFWWGSVFLVGPPVMAAALLASRWVLPRTPRARRAGRRRGWMWSVWCCRWRPCCRSCTRSRSWRAADGRSGRWPRWLRGRCAGRCSCGGSGGCATRCWIWACSVIDRKSVV